MNQSEEVAETRKRVENQYGKELASKASDAFCLAFGRQAPQVFAAIEGGIAGTLPTRAVVVEFVPQQGRIEEVRTSFAAPHVTGLLALILEGEPDLTPNQQRKRLLSVCTPLDGFDVNEQGAGLVSLTGLL